VIVLIQQSIRKKMNQTTKRETERICDCVDSAKNQKEEDESNDDEKNGTD
jgi:hypothetical protein